MSDSTEPNNSGSPKERFIRYSRSRKGGILLAETVISLVVLICYAASIYSGYVTVAICEMVFAGIFFFVFMMDWDKQFPFVSWVWSVSCFSLERCLQCTCQINDYFNTCLFKMLHRPKGKDTFSFSLQDFFRVVVGAVLYLITSLICVISGSKDAALLAGGVRVYHCPLALNSQAHDITSAYLFLPAPVLHICNAFSTLLAAPFLKAYFLQMGMTFVLMTMIRKRSRESSLALRIAWWRFTTTA
uniref:Proteolipid protein 2-like n=1 Tax=Paramormyrops kingsleyae TaxID=1676925 RepID=A0A3B3SC97_9TELE